MAAFSAASVLPTGAARRPVVLLSMGTFALGTDAFVISGVLPRIGHDLGVGLGAAGQLITIFSAVYALAAPLLAVLTGNWNRGGCCCWPCRCSSSPTHSRRPHPTTR